MAFAAGLSGNDEALLATQERVHHSYLQAGHELAAARTAFWIGYRLIPLGEVGRAQGWLARAQRIVDGVKDECPERGYLLLPAVHRQLAAGNLDEAQALAISACEIGERCREPDLIALARILRGRVITKQGQIERGLALFDDAMLTAVAQELSPVVTGLVYCNVIAACSQVYAFERAREWTAALTRWCDTQPQLVTFAGTCLVHRAELMELGGDWGDAFDEARRAELRLSPVSDPKAAADALYQQAEIHRLRGELVEAEETYTRASRRGREPLPGLALLRVVQGRSETAANSMRRVIASTTDCLQRTRYLPAHVEIMLAVGAVNEARVAADELEQVAATFQTDVLRAMAAQARAAVLLASGSAHATIDLLRSALLVWQKLGAPYLAARLQVLLGRACHELGDTDAADLAWSAAHDVLVQLGAAPDLAALAALRACANAAPSRPSLGVASGLSTRELQVLRLVATGKTNRVIASELCLSEKTVDRHVSNIFVKTQVSSRAAATAYAYEHGLV